jgi:hypothetical protein
MEVFSDHPDKLGRLVPDQTKRAANTDVTTWMLPPNVAPYWVACVYSNSRVLLAKPLPRQATRCQMTEAVLHKKTNGIVSFVCD